MANTIISPTIFSREVVRNRDKKNVFMKYVNRDYEGQIKQAGDSVKVQTLPTLSMTAKSITGAGNGTVGTGPGGKISGTDFTIKVETLIVDKYSEILISLRDIEITQSNISLEQKVAERMAEAEARMMDEYIRDLVLVDKLTSIPEANKINKSSPKTLTKDNVIEEIEKMIVALDEQNISENNRVLFVEPKIVSMLRQSKLLDESDEGLKQKQKGFSGMYNGISVVQTTALQPSHEMIMMQKDAINAVVQMTKTDVRQGTDGFYENILATIVWGGNIFGENGKAIVINYIA